MPVYNSHVRRARFLVRVGAWRSLRFLFTRIHAQDAGKAWDIPFAVLDEIFSLPKRIEPDLTYMIRQLPAGQSALFAAILHSHRSGNTTPLDDLAGDRKSHPLTRLEAKGWSLFLGHRCLPKDLAGTGPVNLIQFWDASTPPEIEAGRIAWAGVAPGRHRMFDDRTATDALSTLYGAEMARLYRRLWHPAVKSDVFRMAWIVAKGGAYVDADTRPLKGSGAFLKRAANTCFAVSSSNLPKCVTLNHFIGGAVQEPLWTAYLEHVLRRIGSRDAGPIYMLTGPGALTQFLYDNRDAAFVEPLRLLPTRTARKTLLKQIDAPYKNTARSWSVYEHQLGIRDTDLLSD